VVVFFVNQEKKYNVKRHRNDLLNSLNCGNKLINQRIRIHQKGFLKGKELRIEKKE